MFIFIKFIDFIFCFLTSFCVDKFKGKSVSDTIDGLDSERYYVIKDKDNKELAEGRLSDGDFNDSLLSKPINNIEVKEPGSEEETIYLYV